MRSRQLQARGNGWSYDDACLVERIESMERRACDEAFLAGERCNYYYGSQREGERCGRIWSGMNDCAPGLWCRAGLCFDPENPVYLAEGEACAMETPNGPVALGFCAPDQPCHFETYVCTPMPEIGEACTGKMLCNGGYCDEEVCVPTRAEGDACSHWTECRPEEHCHEEDRVCIRLESPICRNLMP